jgi:hypothetical protein
MLPATTYAYDNSVTEVYDIPPGTMTNSGGSAGILPGAYSGSATGVGETPSTSLDDGRATATGNGSSHGHSTPYDRYYHGPPASHSTSLVPTDSPLEDGDYLVADGSMMRVIHGKPYQLVQYFQPISPILPGFSGEYQSQSSTQPQIPQTSTSVQILSEDRTAIQMTNQFGQVPIPSYDSLLNLQESGSHVVSPGVITVTAPPATTTIVPDHIIPVETVPSLDYSEYFNIGSVSASPPLNGVGGKVNEEVQRSIWSIMASQNHDLLLYSPANP